MRKIRTAAALFMAFCMCFALSACGSSIEDSGAGNADNTQADNIQADNTRAESTQTQQDTKEDAEMTAQKSSETAAGNEESAQPEQDDTESDTDVLVVVFSATGTTKGVAEKIAAIEDADLYEIIPSEPYSDADLNWNDKGSRSTKEQNDPKVRPAIASESIDLSGYSRIYVGYPIWWGEEPRIMDTFVESYDFGDATVIPFCTSGGSGIGRSGKNLAENAGSGNWLDGARHSGSISEDELRSWINGLK